MTIGDNFNDGDAGVCWIGVAMGNAPADVKAVAQGGSQD